MKHFLSYKIVIFLGSFDFILYISKAFETINPFIHTLVGLATLILTIKKILKNGN